MLPTHPTRTLAPLLLVLAVLARPATADAQSPSDPDHLYRSEQEGYTELVRQARVLTAAILNNKEWHHAHHQFIKADEKGTPEQVATRYTFVQEPVLRMALDHPKFVLKFRVIQHDSHDIQRKKARGLSPSMDPTDEVFWIQLDDETPEKFRGSRLSRLKPESVSEWRDGAVLPDEMISPFPPGWPTPAILEEARAERAVEAFKKMLGVWEELLATHEKLVEMEARSFLEEMAANQELRMKYRDR